MPTIKFGFRVNRSAICFPLLLLLATALHSLCSETNSVEESAKSYAARGVIKKIAADHRQLTIHHEAIPDYMMEMTMDFPVKSTNELNGLAAGDQITFTLVVHENDDWIENIQRVGHVAETSATTIAMPFDMPPELKQGDLMPDGELLAENGRHIHFSDFRGQVVAFTFFFTRCPLPDYCPLMNRNFATAQKLISSTPNAPTNWQFLSISFDPGFDTPEMLSSYAGFYRIGDASHWLFAVASTGVLTNLAPRLDLMIMHEGNSISHNLRTIVLDPNGIIYRQLDGNEWTPKELADAVLEAAQLPAML
jgi:protein SCO1/2